MKRLGTEDTSVLALMAELAENDELTKQAQTLLAARLKSPRARRIGRALVSKPVGSDAETRRVVGFFQKWAKTNNERQTTVRMVGAPIRTKAF